MQTLFLITALDKLTGNVYNPCPCLFETEEEADTFIKLNKSKTVFYAKKKVYVGKYTEEYIKSLDKQRKKS